jgi:hypothetical protein
MVYICRLGSGRRLFPDEGTLTTLRPVDSKPTTTGVMIATYQNAEPASVETV